MSPLKLTFEYLGRNRTLNKHPVIQAQLRKNEITEEQARLAPWYLRAEINGKEQSFKLAVDDDDAIASAKSTLKGQSAKPAEFAAFLEDRAARNGVTLQTLADDWIKLDMPDNAGRPRSEKARDILEPLVCKALTYWGNKPAATVTKGMMLTYATHCRNHCKEIGRGTGDRRADKHLSALSCLCSWAAAYEKIKSNPFLERPRIQDAADVEHCHEFTTDSDEQWHQVLNWFFTFPTYELHLRVAGGWLAFCGLVGLRREEPRFLHRYERLKKSPPSPDKLPPGTIFPLRTGELMMKVQRVKNGQNPYVKLHPAALDFLNTWETWLDSTFNYDASTDLCRPWFPSPYDLTKALNEKCFRLLNERLIQACQKLKLNRLTTHGFGRAYYVRVRRSQGADDATIAGEIGQTTNGKLIRDVYGNGDDLRGGAFFDWLPEEKNKPASPAWAQLLNDTTATNIIKVKL